MSVRGVTAQLPTATQFSREGIEAALVALDVDYKLGPKEFAVYCPWHGDDDKRHLYINGRDKPGVYHCFHSHCDVRGQFEAYVQKISGWTVRQTLLWLKPYICNDFVPPPPALPQALPRLTMRPFRKRHVYCYERGLDEETLLRFDVGYDPELNDIIFPWYDTDGKLYAIKRRNVLDKFYRVEALGPITHIVFGINLVQSGATVWLCEGEFDAMHLDMVLRSLNLTDHYAVALGGRILHAAQFEWLDKQRSPKKVVLALDNDEVGREASAKIRRTILERVICYPFTYPEGVKDPAETSPAAIKSFAQWVDQQSY